MARSRVLVTSPDHLTDGLKAGGTLLEAIQIVGIIRSKALRHERIQMLKQALAILKATGEGLDVDAWVQHSHNG